MDGGGGYKNFGKQKRNPREATSRTTEGDMVSNYYNWKAMGNQYHNCTFLLLSSIKKAFQIVWVGDESVTTCRLQRTQGNPRLEKVGRETRSTLKPTKHLLLQKDQKKNMGKGGK